MDDVAAVMFVIFAALAVVVVMAGLVWAAVQDGHRDPGDRA